MLIATHTRAPRRCGLLRERDAPQVGEALQHAHPRHARAAPSPRGRRAPHRASLSLPTTSSPDGPLAQLPPPTTQLPRAKPLPKPKAPTKWERFAQAKGIQKKRREKKVWDEERQEWVNRWGWKGANKDKEVQWITEVPANAGAHPFFPFPFEANLTVAEMWTSTR